MDTNPYFLPSYKGTKTFSQDDIHTAKATGFGAAADDYAERGIDLNEQLIRNKAATFFMRVNSDAMQEVGIYKGDVVIVDRSVEPKHKSIVIASVGEELLIRRLEICDNQQRLTAGKRLAPLEISHLQLWGVVTYIIHKL